MPNFEYLKREIKGWWENLYIIDWLKRSPILILSVSILLVIGLFAFLITLTLPEKEAPVDTSEKQWFYDLKHQRLFVAEKQLPPIEAPSGPFDNGELSGVRAYVFTYNNDPNTTDYFIGFLETTDPNVEKSSIGPTDLRVSGAEMFTKGRLIRRVKDKKWVEANSEEGKAILKETFHKKKDGKVPQYLPPPK
jgi:hypothetical protein